MLKFTVLGSGSSGNSVLISNDKTNVLIDAGLSAREILRRVSAVGIHYEKIDAVVITHEHSDHIGGLRVLMQTLKCPVFLSELTLEAYFRQTKEKEYQKRLETLHGRTVTIDSNSHFKIGSIDFYPFSVPHDAADNFGFVAESNGIRIASVMDFGQMTTLINEKLRRCDAIVIESNHNRDMLMACPFYPWELKQRIASNTGHFSNEDLSKWLTNDFDGKASYIVLAHLSQRTNEPNLALLSAQTALNLRPQKCETKLLLSHPKEPTEWIIF
ncbi:MAG: MBL fold metallo-hydrolase [Pyrinomonadaceae bacterium]|nr:MBL fold metallo-hydrolase [Pyrinomonadaceae bacterium]MCX7639457.1 MBL fold metallo-hydrolase [Pyrinomonadaceae bacterium]